MLQSFATSYVIENMGYDCEYIVYRKKKDPAFYLKALPRLLDRTLLNDKLQVLQKKTALMLHPEAKKNNDVRYRAFERFQKKYYRSFSKELYGYDELCKGAKEYDTVLVGSDQLWLPGGLATNFYNLMFVPDGIRKISYATSFGVSSIPKRQYKKTKEYLDRIEYISVRERTGAKIVKEVSGRDAVIVADPTLLLDRSQWESVIPDRRPVDEPYVFCYFLGKNEKHRDAAEEFAKKTGLKIVSTPFLDSYVKRDEHFGDQQLFDVGPDDFVNLIRNAEYILTDSFHGSVFSIINHKKFVTFNRFDDGSSNSRNSRIDNLCELLGIKDRRYDAGADIAQTAKAPVDYESVDEKLASLRAESLLFLKNALEG